MPEQSILAAVQQDLAAIVAPLRARREQLVSQRDALRLELNELNHALASLDATLRRLDPNAEPYRQRQSRNGNKPTHNARGEQQLESESEEMIEKREKIRAYLSQRAAKQFPEGFSATQLAQALREANPDGGHPGHDLVHAYVKRAHERGELRAVAKVRGGGTLYKIVGAR